jgi:hypothetical protein
MRQAGEGTRQQGNPFEIYKRLRDALNEAEKGKIV